MIIITTTQKKDTVICLAGARSLLRPEKKRYSRLSGGCAIIITTGKKRYLAGCAVVSVFGSGGKLAVFLLWRESFITSGKKKIYSCLSGGCAIIITTGKKSSSHLSGGCAIVITTGKKSSSRLSGRLCCCVSFWFWQEIGSFYVVAGKFYYDRKKKF